MQRHAIPVDITFSLILWFVSPLLLVYVSQLAQKLAKKSCTIKHPDIASLTTPSPAKKQQVKYYFSTNTRKTMPSKAIIKTPTPTKVRGWDSVCSVFGRNRVNARC